VVPEPVVPEPVVPEPESVLPVYAPPEPVVHDPVSVLPELLLPEPESVLHEFVAPDAVLPDWEQAIRIFTEVAFESAPSESFTRYIKASLPPQSPAGALYSMRFPVILWIIPRVGGVTISAITIESSRFGSISFVRTASPVAVPASTVNVSNDATGG